MTELFLWQKVMPCTPEIRADISTVFRALVIIYEIEARL
jgi:hypothetical protein